MEHLYLDHAATTPLDPEVLDAMLPYLVGNFGNPSSVHWFGRQSRSALENARETIAQIIGADAGEIYFMSGGTEADNMALRGAFLSGRAEGRNVVATGAAEHHAVLDTVRALGAEGATPCILPVDVSGAVRIRDLEAQLDDKVAVLSLMHSNNEVGTFSPIREIADIAHAHGIPVHTDAVQSLGKVPLNVQDLDVDLMTLTAHKLYGPKGIGVLYVKRGTALAPLLTGGGQERGKRPGTESVALAVGFARAAEIAVASMEQESPRLRTLRDNFEARFLKDFPAAQLNGNPEDRLPHISSISFSNEKLHLEGEMLIPALDLRGIALSSGSACTSGSIQPSHVLIAMGRDVATAKATMRFSFGKGTGEDHIDRVLAAVTDVVKKNTVS